LLRIAFIGRLGTNIAAHHDYQTLSPAAAAAAGGRRRTPCADVVREINRVTGLTNQQHARNGRLANHSANVFATHAAVSEYLAIGRTDAL